MTETDVERLKDYCENCDEDHIHTTHGRCLGCLRRDDNAAERLAEETGEPIERFTSDAEIPELDELESVGVDDE